MVKNVLRDDERHDDNNGDDNDLHHPNVWSEGSKDASMARTKSVTYPMTKKLAITAAVSSSLPPKIVVTVIIMVAVAGVVEMTSIAILADMLMLRFCHFQEHHHHFWICLVWPIIRNMKDTFFINQLNALGDIAKSNL